MFKNLVYAAIGLLIVAVGGGVLAFSQPSDVQTTVAAVNYTHQGNFNYTARQQASYIFGDLSIDDVLNGQPASSQTLPPQANPKYPIQYIDALNMSFSYQVTANANVNTSADISIAALFQKDSKQQTLALPAAVSVAGGVYTARFSLPLSTLLTSPTFTVQATIYSTIIQAGTAPIFESYTQSLAFQAQAPYLEINKTLENSTQASFGALAYKQSGAFSYAVTLNAASPYGAITLTPSVPAAPTPAAPVLSTKIFKPGDTIFSDLFDSMNVSYTYNLSANVPVNQLNETVQVMAVLENPGVWTKSFVLVPSSVKSGPFTVNFTLTAEDLANYIDVYQAVRQETGSTADFSLAIVATVHATGKTDYGLVDDTFTQTLSTKLGEPTLAWNEKLTLSKSGSINQLQSVPNKIKYIGLTVQDARIITGVLAGCALVFLIVLLTWRILRRGGGYAAGGGETQRIQGLFKDSLIRVTELPAPGANETVVKTDSAEDLSRTGFMTLKPVLYYRQADGQDVYCVIDGSTRYQYVPNRK